MLERDRTELITLLIVAASVAGVLEGFHLGGVEMVAVVGVGATLALVSVGILQALAVSEAIFVVEAVVVSVLMPPLIEPTLRFEALGVWLAFSFVLGVVCNRMIVETESGAHT